MHIQKVYMENFGPHAALFVELPENGLFLVTGHNGAGKSTVIEAVNWAIWGKTLRGAAMYQKKQDCIVRVHLESGIVERTRSKSGRGAVTFTDKNGNCTEFDTAADAAVALEQMFGPAPNWRRTHVFSSNDPILFSAASDGDKKRLLESLLGLEKFDQALASCRSELVAAKADYEKAIQKNESSDFRIEQLEHNLKQQENSLAALSQNDEKFVHTEEGAIREEWAKTADELKWCKNDISELEEDKTEKKNEFLLLKADAKTKMEAFKAVESGQCSTCGSTIPEENLCTLQKGAIAANEAVSAKKVEVGGEIKEIDEKLANLRNEAQKLESKVGTLLSEAEQAKAQNEAAERLESSKKVVSDAIEALKSELSGAILHKNKTEKAETAARQKSEILQYTEAVLGLKGVRAHVLSNALGGIQDAANAWLARICETPMKIRLSATDKGAMTMEVDGAGGGNGYKGSSGGERRRIDISLLLALADVAAGASSGNPGTLFLDEVLDAIDEEGVGLLSSALQEVSDRRPIILITHSETLAHAVGQFASGHLNLRLKNGGSGA